MYTGIVVIEKIHIIVIQAISMKKKLYRAFMFRILLFRLDKEILTEQRQTYGILLDIHN